MMPIFGMQGSQIALLLGIGLFVFVLLRRVRRGFGESPRTKQHRSVAGAASQLVLKTKAQESWEVEMQALARQLKGEIETKMRALERLVQMADEARGELDTSIERAESLGLLERGELAAAPVSRERNEEYAAAPGGRPAPRNIHAQSARKASSSSRLRLGEDLGDDPRFERVYALADAGFSAPKIASQVGSQVGEVELILSLRRTDSADAM